jgi:hypothetical protein
VVSIVVASFSELAGTTEGEYGASAEGKSGAYSSTVPFMESI